MGSSMTQSLAKLLLCQGREWTRQILEKTLQSQSDQMLTLCAKTGEPLKRKSGGVICSSTRWLGG
jgi:hypothetical protein